MKMMKLIEILVMIVDEYLLWMLKKLEEGEEWTPYSLIIIIWKDKIDDLSLFVIL
jgi:hypothetical protein